MERRRKGREEGEKGETAENRQGKIRGLRREEVTPGETHLPHQLWSVCLSVLGDGWTASREKKASEPQKQFVKRSARLRPKPHCGHPKSCVWIGAVYCFLR